jgi:hypothetical protein
MRSVSTDPEQHARSASPAEQQRSAAPRPASAPGGYSLHNEFGLPLAKWHPAAAQNANEPVPPEPAAPKPSATAPAHGEQTAAGTAREEPNRSGPAAALPSRTVLFSGAMAAAETEAEAAGWVRSPHAATHGAVQALKQRLTQSEREVRVTLGLLKGVVCFSVAGVVGVGALTASRSCATPHDGSSVRAPFQAALPTGSHHRLSTVPAQRAAVETGGNPIRVAAVPPAGNRKPVRGVIGTAVRGQKLGSHPPAKVAAKPARARKVKPTARTHGLKLPAGRRIRHQRRHHWRSHWGRYHWRSGGSAPREWPHSGRSRLPHFRRWRGQGYSRHWRRG